MSLFTKMFEAVQSWRRRRVAVRPRSKAVVKLEQLDHRQLLAVNFTGNVAVDFPATANPGVVILPNNPSVVHPLIPGSISPLVKVSGLDINGIRVTYTPTDDTLSIGLEQPDNQKTGQPVIAGDTDNNLDNGTVAPDVLAIEPAFIDFPGLGGTETMGAFLDLDGNGTPDVVAGISNEIGQPKTYQVTNAVVNPSNIPIFGTPLPANRGNVFLVNDPAHGAFEFSITNFSQLYQSKTGLTLTPETVIKIGAFGNSGDDDGISEAFFPPGDVPIGPATPPPPPVCPPANPPVVINPHSARHINTAHETNIRVNIFSTSEFDTRQIDPATVRLGGATPIFSFSRKINRDGFPDTTFVFNGLDVDLPRGITTATVTGQTFDGREFRTTTTVFNRDDSYYPQSSIASRNNRLGRSSASALNSMAADVALHSMNYGTPTPVLMAAQAVPAEATPATVSIPKRNRANLKAAPKVKVSPRMARAAQNAVDSAVFAGAQTAY